MKFCGSVVRNPSAKAGDTVDLWSRKIPHGVGNQAVSHNYLACALKPGTRTTEAHVPWEPIVCNKRSHHSEKPAHCNCKQPSLTTREKPVSSKDLAQSKVNKCKILKMFYPS